MSINDLVEAFSRALPPGTEISIRYVVPRPGASTSSLSQGGLSQLPASDPSGLPQADAPMKLKDAAHRYGVSKPALERLLATQPQWAINHTADFTLALMQLQDLGLHIERLLADMASPKVRDRIRQDVADANALGVRATPEYFVNGKPMPSFGFQQLLDLVNEALAQTGG